MQAQCSLAVKKIVRAVSSGVLVLIVSLNFGQAEQPQMKPVGSKKNFGILDQFPDKELDAILKKSLFERLDIPLGQGVAALCLDRKVFGIDFSHQRFMVATSGSYFPIYADLREGVSMEHCDEKDFKILDYAMTRIVPGQPQPGMLKICLFRKIFYYPNYESMPIQSIVDGKAEKCYLEE